MDPKQLQPHGCNLDSLVIHYPEDLTNEAEKKKYRSKLLKDHPETLKADFKRQGDRAVITDLLFFTEHPEAWHATLREQYDDLKMIGNKSIRQLYTGTVPKFNINFYNTGTVMVQGSQTRMEEFEKDFSRLKTLVGEKKTSVPLTTAPTAQSNVHIQPSAIRATVIADSPSQPSAPSTTAPTSHVHTASSTPPSARFNNPHTPRTPVSVQRIQECLSLLEVEIIEFKENKLSESDTIQQMKNEIKLFKEETNTVVV